MDSGLAWPVSFEISNGSNFCSGLTSAISLYAQVQFHAKYPLIDSQSEREFAFSYAILQEIHTCRSKPEMIFIIFQTTCRHKVKLQDFVFFHWGKGNWWVQARCNFSLIYDSVLNRQRERYAIACFMTYVENENFIQQLSTMLTCRDVISAELSIQAPVVQRLDNAIHRINHYPADSAVCFGNTYPLDSDLSGG